MRILSYCLFLLLLLGVDTTSFRMPAIWGIRGGDDGASGTDFFDWAESNGVVLSNDIEIQRNSTTGSRGGVSWKEIPSRKIAGPPVSEEHAKRSLEDSGFVVNNLEWDGEEKCFIVNVTQPDGKEGVFFYHGPDYPITDNERKTLITIPSKLVLSSTMVSRELRARTKAALKHVDFDDEQYTASFCLFLKVLEEDKKGRGSFWYPYFNYLPKKFGSGIYWTEKEREYAKRIALGGTLDALDKKWNAYQVVLDQVLPDNKYHIDRIKWAFSITSTRSWIIRRDDDGEMVADLVCIGDMFNHRDNGTVVPIQDDGLLLQDDGCVKMVTAGEEQGCKELYMNYGHAGRPHHLMVHYGFVDTDSLVFPAVLAIKSCTKFGRNAFSMGFHDYQQMAFRTDTGAYTDTLYNAIVYDIVKANIGVDDPLEAAFQHVANLIELVCTKIYNGEDVDSADLAFTTQQTLRFKNVALEELLDAVVTPVLNIIGPIPDEEVNEDEHPHWRVLVRFHQQMLDNHKKAQKYLQTEQALLEKEEGQPGQE